MALTALCVVASLVLCGFIIQYTRVIRASQVVQIQWIEMQNILNYRNMMITDLKENAKRDPEILRILQPLAGVGSAPAKSPAK